MGSILRGDDGIGQALVDSLLVRPPPKWDLMAADVSGLDLIKYTEFYQGVVIADAASMGEDPGSLRLFSVQDILKSEFPEMTSSHGMGLKGTLALMERLGLNRQIRIIGIQPAQTDFSLGLSDELKALLPEITKKVLEILKDLGVSYEPVFIDNPASI